MHVVICLQLYNATSLERTGFTLRLQMLYTHLIPFHTDFYITAITTHKVYNSHYAKYLYCIHTQVLYTVVHCMYTCCLIF